MDDFFIDKLNVVQDHYSNGLKLVAKEMLIRVDLQTGDEVQIPTRLKLEGSYSSSLFVRCNGSRVEVYGNPSRYQRIDNLFGLKTFDQCIAVYNQVLLKLGLPPFTKCKKLMPVQVKEDQAQTWIADGACIKHVDFTRNHVVGQGNEQDYLKALSSQSIGRSIKPYLYPNGNTVDWFGANLTKNGSTHRYVKCYAKSIDLERHAKKTLKGVNHSDHKYYEKLITYCKEQGVVREEHSFKNRWLKDQCLFAYGLVKETQFKPYLTCIDDIRNRLEVSEMANKKSIVDELINLGICKNQQSANTTQNFYLMWLNDMPFKRNRQYYVHKSRLKQLGIDISVPCDLTRTPIKLKNVKLIECKPLAVPEWYKKPQTNYLKQVA